MNNRREGNRFKFGVPAKELYKVELPLAGTKKDRSREREKDLRRNLRRDRLEDDRWS